MELRKLLRKLTPPPSDDTPEQVLEFALAMLAALVMICYANFF